MGKAGEGPSTHLCSPGVGPAPASRLPGVWPQAGSSWSAKSDLQDGVPSLLPPPRGPSGAPGGLLSGSRRPPPDTTAIRKARCWPEQGGPGMLAAIPLCPRQCPAGAIPGFRARLGARVSPGTHSRGRWGERPCHTGRVAPSAWDSGSWRTWGRPRPTALPTPRLPCGTGTAAPLWEDPGRGGSVRPAGGKQGHVAVGGETRGTKGAGQGEPEPQEVAAAQARAARGRPGGPWAARSQQRARGGAGESAGEGAHHKEEVMNMDGEPVTALWKT